MLQFKAYGHPNITAKHRTTLEFTKDSKLTLKGDCIIGVRADFNAKRIQDFMIGSFDFIMHIIIGDESITLNAQYNQKFNDDEEIVLRRGIHDSTRTMGMVSSHAAIDLTDTMVAKLKDPNQEVIIQIEKTTE